MLKSCQPECKSCLQVIARVASRSRTLRNMPTEGVNDPNHEYAMTILPMYVDAVDRRAVEARERIEHDTATRQALAEAKTDGALVSHCAYRFASLAGDTSQSTCSEQRGVISYSDLTGLEKVALLSPVYGSHQAIKPTTAGHLRDGRNAPYLQVCTVKK